MSNILNDYIFSLDEQGRKPTILVNIADDDVTRGDTAGRKGLAEVMAKKIDADILYADKPKLDKLYPDTETQETSYSDKLVQFLSQYRPPDIVIGLACSQALEKIGKLTWQVLYITDYNESLSSCLINENSIVAHHLTKDMLKEEGEKFNEAYPELKKPIIGVFLVDAPPSQQDFFVEKISKIATHYKEATIFLCGSRRTSNLHYSQLKNKLEKSVEKNIQIDGFQFDRNAEFNPYRGLIAQADHFILWGNSMSMMSEPLITGKTVHLYNAVYVSETLEKRKITADFSEASEDKPLLTKHFAPINITEKLGLTLINKFKKENKDRFKVELKRYKKEKYPKSWHEHLIKVFINHNHFNKVPKKLRTNHDFIKACLKQNGMVIQHLPDISLDNSELTIEAAVSNLNALDFIKKDFLDDSEVMFHIINPYSNDDATDIYKKCSDRLKLCPDFTLKVLKKKVRITDDMDSSLFNNQDICLHSIILNEKHTRDIPNKFINDPVFVKKILEANIYCFRYLPDKQKKELQNIDLIFEKGQHLIAHAGDVITDNEDIMSRFISKETSLFSYASDRLRNKKSFIIHAFKHGDISYSLSDKSKNNKEIMMQSVKKNFYNITLCSPSLQNDTDICEIALSKEPYDTWSELTEKAKKNPDISFMAVQKCPMLWNYMNANLRNNKKFSLRCASLPEFPIKNFNPDFLSDKNFVKKLISIQPSYLDAPELADTLKALGCKTTISSTFNSITPTMRIIKNLKKRFKQPPKLKP